MSLHISLLASYCPDIEKSRCVPSGILWIPSFVGPNLGRNPHSCSPVSKRNSTGVAIPSNKIKADISPPLFYAHLETLWIGLNALMALLASVHCRQVSANYSLIDRGEGIERHYDSQLRNCPGEGRNCRRIGNPQRYVRYQRDRLALADAHTHLRLPAKVPTAATSTRLDR